MDVLNRIKDFIYKVSLEYPSLHIDYEYDSEEDEYFIWHNNAELEYDNPLFKSFVAKAAREYLFDDNIYNFCFVFDYYKSLEIEKESKKYNLVDVTEVDVEYNYRTNNKTSDYTIIKGSESKRYVFLEGLVIMQDTGRLNKSREYSRFYYNYPELSNVYNQVPFKEAS